MECFDRQIILPELEKKGQQKLQSAKVLVVGAGGLDCPAILYMAAVGVGTIRIAGGDRFALCNLNRQILFGHKDVGSSKTDVAARYITERFQNIQIETFRESDDYPSGKNSGCIEIPSRQLTEKSELFSDATSVFLFCQYGIRSRPAAMELRRIIKRKSFYSVTGGVETS
ncbi:MAG: ThiF family adenylyltransferase [Draconibacterium sp.]|nr:ThiF family adenylyltransferase [Draconibacterium sp.]